MRHDPSRRRDAVRPRTSHRSDRAVGDHPGHGVPPRDLQSACEALRDQFTRRYRDLAPQAVERLLDDWDRLVTFYQFPQAHWRHLRTTTVVESPFAAVRLQTTATKRFKKVTSATALI